MLKEFRFILLFSVILSLVQLSPSLLTKTYLSENYYVFVIVLSLNTAILFVLAFSEEYHSKMAFYLLVITIIFYLYILPYAYMILLPVAIMFIILELLFVVTIIFFIILDFLSNVFDRDISLLEKADTLLFKTMNGFYKFVSGDKNEKKLQKNNC